MKCRQNRSSWVLKFSYTYISRSRWCIVGGERDRERGTETETETERAFLWVTHHICCLKSNSSYNFHVGIKISNGSQWLNSVKVEFLVAAQSYVAQTALYCVVFPQVSQVIGFFLNFSLPSLSSICSSLDEEREKRWIFTVGILASRLVCSMHLPTSTIWCYLDAK